MGMVNHSQSSQISKFAMSWQYLKKVDRDKVYFLHVDKRQKLPTIWFQYFGRHNVFLQGNNIIIDGMIKHYQSTQINKLGMEFIFACIETSKFLQVGIIHFDGSG